jgi:hypothetical protein
MRGRHAFSGVAAAAHLHARLRAGGGGCTIRLGPSRRELVSHAQYCFGVVGVVSLMKMGGSVGGGFAIFIRRHFLDLVAIMAVSDQHAHQIEARRVMCQRYQSYLYVL